MLSKDKKKVFDFDLAGENKITWKFDLRSQEKRKEQETVHESLESYIDEINFRLDNRINAGAETKLKKNVRRLAKKIMKVKKTKTSQLASEVIS